MSCVYRSWCILSFIVVPFQQLITLKLHRYFVSNLNGIRRHCHVSAWHDFYCACALNSMHIIPAERLRTILEIRPLTPTREFVAGFNVYEALKPSFFCFVLVMVFWQLLWLCLFLTSLVFHFQISLHSDKSLRQVGILHYYIINN